MTLQERFYEAEKWLATLIVIGRIGTSEYEQALESYEELKAELNKEVA